VSTAILVNTFTNVGIPDEFLDEAFWDSEKNSCLKYTLKITIHLVPS
jgi:hypothetical protein